MKLKTFLSLISVVFLLSFADAQKKIPADLESALYGKRNVREIMSIVDRHYDFGKKQMNNRQDEEEYEENDYTWWKRWEYWSTRHLKADGTLADYLLLNYQAILDVEKKSGSAVHQSGTGNSTRSFGKWIPYGPSSQGVVVSSGTNIDINGIARIDRITFHPSNASIMFVCSPSGGIYKTENGGGSWVDYSQGLPGGAACIELAPSDGNILYAFSGDGDSHYSNTFVMSYLVSPKSYGIFKSTNSGLSWTKLQDLQFTGSGDLVGRNFAISPGNSNFVFAATNKGLYRTVNGGLSWEQVRIGDYTDVEFRPHDDSTLYASSTNKIEYSTGGGRSGTWNTSSFDIDPATTRIMLGVRNNNSNTQSDIVYAITSGASTGAFKGLYRSTNAGQSFSRRCSTPNILGSTVAGNDDADQSNYDLGICIKPTDDNYVVTGALCVWRSNGSNGGSSMISSSTYRESLGAASSYIHPDVHDVQYNPLNNNLYACTDGGVYKSTDDGQTWSMISTGLYATQLYHMRMRDSNGDGIYDGPELIAGAQDNGIKYNPGSQWRHLICCDGYDALIKGKDPNTLVVSFNDRAYRSTDGGVNMTSLYTTSAFTPLAQDFDFDDTMYMATRTTLRRSYNGFASSTQLNFDRNNFITTCPSNNARLYGSSSNKYDLFKSDDRGTSWTAIYTNPGYPNYFPTITCCTPSLTNSDEIYVGIAGYIDTAKVFRSTNGGNTWTNYTANLPNVPIHCLAVAAEGIYAGTEIGVFFRPANSGNWIPFYNGMPNVIVTDIRVHTNDIFASTFGSGIWGTQRYSACDEAISVTGNLYGNNYFDANTSATVTAGGYSGTGTNVFVKSNGYIDLMDGFAMQNGTFFEAYLGPCGTGIPLPPASAADISRIIEYDDKDQQQQRKSSSAYYRFVEDGIELNLPNDAVVEVELYNVQSRETMVAVDKVKLHRGMFKILTGRGEFSVKVKMNGTELQKFAEEVN